MILNLGCLSLELNMKWNIKSLRSKKAKRAQEGDPNVRIKETEEAESYYYISYDSFREEEFRDLHYACSSPTSSCSHGNTSHEYSQDYSQDYNQEYNQEYSQEYQEIGPQDHRAGQYWSIQSELLLVECC